MAPPTLPEAGDIILRDQPDSEYEVVDTSGVVLACRLTLAAALAFARERTSGALWQQRVDGRGRPMGVPQPLFRRRGTATPP